MNTPLEADNPSKGSIGMWRRFLSDNRLASFKVKLVAYFLLLALLPLAALFWGFTGVAARTETRLVDERLAAGVRSTLSAYEDTLNRANHVATTLARLPAVQSALARRDRPALVPLLRRYPDVRVVAPGGFRVGIERPRAAERIVDVIGPRG